MGKNETTLSYNKMLPNGCGQMTVLESHHSTRVLLLLAGIRPKPVRDLLKRDKISAP